MNGIVDIPQSFSVELVISNETAAKLLVILFIFFALIVGAVMWGKRLG